MSSKRQRRGLEAERDGRKEAEVRALLALQMEGKRPWASECTWLLDPRKRVISQDLLDFSPIKWALDF